MRPVNFAWSEDYGGNRPDLPCGKFPPIGIPDGKTSGSLSSWCRYCHFQKRQVQIFEIKDGRKVDRKALDKKNYRCLAFDSENFPNGSTDGNASRLTNWCIIAHFNRGEDIAFRIRKGGKRGGKEGMFEKEQVFSLSDLPFGKVPTVYPRWKPCFVNRFAAIAFFKRRIMDK